MPAFSSSSRNGERLAAECPEATRPMTPLLRSNAGRVSPLPTHANDAVRAARAVHDQGAGGVAAVFVRLTAVQDQDVLVAQVLVPRHDGAGLVAQQGRGGTVLPRLIEAADVHAGTQRLPTALFLER